MNMARHTFGDWVREPNTGNVGMITVDLPKRTVIVRWLNGTTSKGPFQFDLITEYEYFKVVDPKRCGADIPELVEAIYAGAQRDYFTGGIFRNTMIRQTSKDLFQ